MHKTWYKRGECITENIWLLVLIWFFAYSYMGIGLSAQGVNMNRLPGY